MPVRCGRRDETLRHRWFSFRLDGFLAPASRSVTSSTTSNIVPHFGARGHASEVPVVAGEFHKGSQGIWSLSSSMPSLSDVGLGIRCLVACASAARATAAGNSRQCTAARARGGIGCLRRPEAYSGTPSTVSSSTMRLVHDPDNGLVDSWSGVNISLANITWEGYRLRTRSRLCR